MNALSTTETDIYDEIDAFRRREDATILAHYYQDGEIQELADYTGDSLKLARLATRVESPTIVFCGVHFMAETAKMLNPDKRVLLPDLRAGCSLAESCPAPALARRQAQLRAEGRRFQTVTYINSSAAVKALSDWVVTSGNAQQVIKRVPDDVEILFVPDRHLGQYLVQVTGRPMILWNGSCMVHEMFSVGDLLKLKRRPPRDHLAARVRRGRRGPPPEPPGVARRSPANARSWPFDCGFARVGRIDRSVERSPCASVGSTDASADQVRGSMRSDLCRHRLPVSFIFSPLFSDLGLAIYAVRKTNWLPGIVDAPPLACDQKKNKSRQFTKGTDPTKVGETTLGQRNRSKYCPKRKSQIHEGRVERKNDRSQLGSGDANQARLLGREEAPGG